MSASVRSLWDSPRVWTLGAAVLSRGVGFVASFSISRVAGAERLALYMALVVTAASIVAPFSQIFLNGSTVELSDESRRPARALFMRAQAWLAVSLSVALLVAFYALYGQDALVEVSRFGLSPIWLLLVGVSLILAPMLQAVWMGGLSGVGWQTPAARVVTVCAGLLLPFSYPMVHWAGLSGAWCVLLVTLWLPVLGLWLMWRAQVDGASWEGKSAWPDVFRLFRQGLPTAAALAVSGGLVWLCMIRLPKAFWGVEAVALLAIANQWLNLTLLPATTWSAIAMVDMVRAHTGVQSRTQLSLVIRRWLIWNILVTAVMAIGVLLAMPWIESAYRMPDNELRAVFAWSATTALFMAAFGVIERLLMVLGQQHYLFVATLCGAVFQVGAALWWAPESVMGVQWATLLGAAVVLCTGVWLGRRVWTRVH